MARHGKNYTKARASLPEGGVGVDVAVAAIRSAAYAKFNEAVEVAMNLGVDPRHADQMVRASVVLPHGTGKTKRIVVLASGEKIKEAEEAGADFSGGAELVKKISEGWLDFDSVIATPDMMREVGKLGRVLGPRGLMPNPKTGTVTFDVAKAVTEIKAGKLDFRVDKNGVVHAAVARLSFSDEQISENVRTLFEAVMRAKPAAAKGKYLKSIYMSSTMGPSFSIDVNEAALTLVTT